MTWPGDVTASFLELPNCADKRGEYAHTYANLVTHILGLGRVGDKTFEIHRQSTILRPLLSVAAVSLSHRETMFLVA